MAEKKSIPADDPNIVVGTTEDHETECIYILFVDEGIRIKLHTRSAISLHHKLGTAILNWIGSAAWAIGEAEAEREQ